MKHCFDTEIAKEFGLTEAIILQNIGYWISKNKANTYNLIDGRHWTYNTIKELHTTLDYLSEDEIYRALDRLRKAGVLMVANHNKNKFDRTLWYAFTQEEEMLARLSKTQKEQTDAFCKLQNRDTENAKSITQKQEIDYADLQNGFCTGANSIYTDIKTNINTDVATDVVTPLTPQGGDALPKVEVFEKENQEASTALEDKAKTKKSRSRALKDKVNAHLFVESSIADFSDFEKAFADTDYAHFDLKFYYETVKNWSASKGARKLDWVATSRGFMLRDMQENKAKLSKNVLIQGNASTNQNYTNNSGTGNYAGFKGRDNKNSGHRNIDIEGLNSFVDAYYS